MYSSPPRDFRWGGLNQMLAHSTHHSTSQHVAAQCLSYSVRAGHLAMHALPIASMSLLLPCEPHSQCYHQPKALLAPPPVVTQCVRRAPVGCLQRPPPLSTRTPLSAHVFPAVPASVYPAVSPVSPCGPPTTPLVCACGWTGGQTLCPAPQALTWLHSAHSHSWTTPPLSSACKVSCLLAFGWR
jgi:hypothetical protein